MWANKKNDNIEKVNDKCLPSKILKECRGFFRGHLDLQSQLGHTVPAS